MMEYEDGQGPESKEARYNRVTGERPMSEIAEELAAFKQGKYEFVPDPVLEREREMVEAGEFELSPAYQAAAQPEPDRRHGVFSSRFNLRDCTTAAEKSADVLGLPMWVHMHKHEEPCTDACFLVQPNEARSAALRS